MVPQHWCTTHHMTRRREYFSNLDSTVRGSVKFEDASTVEIEGVGSVIFVAKTGEHRMLTGVYYIPALRNSIISLGQLDENGSRVEIEHGLLRIWDTSSSSRQGEEEEQLPLRPPCQGGATPLPCSSTRRRRVALARALWAPQL